MEVKQEDTTSEDRDGSRASRGRKRTAREIAKMFEQLKERHLQKKRDWKNEKEDLVRQAAVAVESKRILLELKHVLEGLRVELKDEEQKRKEEGKRHQEDKREWEEERTKLLDLIHELETKKKERKIPYKQNLPEVESLKRKLETANREISFTKKLNSELKEENYKLKVEFDIERVKLLKKHDEEERNWENLKHQLLGKIEYLEKINVTSFPLHGSQVTSSSAEDQRHQRSLGELKLGEIAEPTRYNANLQSPNVSMNLSAIPSNYEQFHTTVDAALKQIEKISEDLENINTESPSQSFDLAPPVTTDTCSDQNLISHPTMPRVLDTTSVESSETTIPRDKPGEVFSMMKEDKRKRSKSFCTRSYDDIQPMESPQRRSSISHVSTASLSPVKTISPDTNVRRPSREPSVSPVSITPAHTPSRSFAKVEKHYVVGKPQPPLSGALTPRQTVRKLPNLHQKLLFFNGKTETNTTPSPRPQYSHPVKNVSYPSNFVTTKENHTSVTSADSSSSTQHVEFVSQSPVRTTDSGGITPLKIRVNSVDEDVATFPPPVAPKPSVTIEKDSSGVLRVIQEERPKSATTAEKCLHRNNDDHDQNFISRRRSCTVVEQAPATDKSSIGKLGKTWFKKHLNFRDSGKSEESKSSKTSGDVASIAKGKKSRLKHYTKKEAKSRSVVQSSSSDESTGDVSKSKGKSRRYSRGNVEERRESSDMKSVLSKFRASNFNPKKPGIVKQFERKLLENEVKMLKEPSKPIQAPNSAKMLRKKWILDSQEDGYSGEDELDDREKVVNKDGENSRPKQNSFVTLRKAPTVNDDSTQGFKESKMFRPKPTYRRSMTDLSIQSDFVHTPRSNWTCSAGDASAFHKVSPRSFPQERNTYSEQTTDQIESTTWKQKILQEVPQGTINSPKDLQNASVKPKADEASDKTEQKLIIEKCKRLRPKPKRYSRSETMPLSVNADVIKDIEKFWSKRNPSQEIDEKHEKRKSMPSHTNEGIAPPIPALTQRFKKPSLKNRRVPSRWKKENDN